MTEEREIVQPGFTLFWEDLAMYTDCLTAEQLGHVLQALLCDREGGTPPELDSIERLAYFQLTQKINAQAEKYRQTVERNRENGKKHAGKKTPGTKAAGGKKTPEEPKATQKDPVGPTETETETEAKTETETESRTETETVLCRPSAAIGREEREETGAPAAPLSEETGSGFSSLCEKEIAHQPSAGSQGPFSPAAPLSSPARTHRPGETVPGSALAEEAVREFFSVPGQAGTKPDRGVKKEDTPESAPSVQEVDDYIADHSLCVDAEQFCRYYAAGGWRDRDGKPVRNWKQKLHTWDSKNRGAVPAHTPAFACERPPAYGDGRIDWLEC